MIAPYRTIPPTQIANNVDFKYTPYVFPACSLYSKNRLYPPEFHRTKRTSKNSAPPLLERRLAILSRVCAERLEKIRRLMLYPTELRAQ